MKLRYAPTSPYVRKVLVTAIEAGLDERIERVATNVWDAATDIQDDNPLGKVPALTTDDGTVLCDSPLICEHLDSLHEGAPLIPAAGAERWQVLNTAALGDGIMDSAVSRIIEVRQRPEALRWDDWLARQKGKISKALDVLERQVSAGPMTGPVNLGQIAVGCALGYLDFRFPDDAWRNGRPGLEAWYQAFAEFPSMKATQPPA